MMSEAAHMLYHGYHYQTGVPHQRPLILNKKLVPESAAGHRAISQELQLVSAGVQEVLKFRSRPGARRKIHQPW